MPDVSPQPAPIWKSEGRPVFIGAFFIIMAAPTTDLRPLDEEEGY
jgi:hypothetical protein